MCRSCRYCTIVDLAIILGLLNSSVAMATEPPEDSQCTPCTSGQYYQYFDSNCSCKDCPNGTFRSETVHRNNSCINFTESTHPGCTLIKNGTSRSDNDWNCTIIDTTVIIPNVSLSTPTISSSTISPLEKTLILVVVIISAIVFISAQVLIIFYIWKRKKSRRQHGEARKIDSSHDSQSLAQLREQKKLMLEKEMQAER